MLGSIPESVTTDVRAQAEVRRRRSRVVRLFRRLLRTPAAVVGFALTFAMLLVALFADQIAPVDPFVPVGTALHSPSWAHVMGTDNLGRDVLSGVAHGARTSLIVMVVTVTIASIIGITVGAVSGYRRGLIDDLLMRVTEVFQALPRFFLAVLVVALFGPGIERIILVLGITSWPTLARVVRATILSTSQQDFVWSARALGASELRIVLYHVLPNVAASAVVVIALMGATVVLVEASLGFIGLGDPNVISLGSMARNAQPFMRVAPWLVVFPGVAIVLLTLGLNLVGDAVNDLLNPLRDPRTLGRGRRRRRARG